MRSLLVALGGVLLLGACGSAPPPREPVELVVHLESADPSERAWAVSELCRRRAPEGLAGVVARLRDEDGGIRLMAAGGLRAWTGQDFGYRPFAPEGDREAAVRRWEAWLAEGGDMSGGRAAP